MKMRIEREKNMIRGIDDNYIYCVSWSYGKKFYHVINVLTGAFVKPTTEMIEKLKIIEVL